MFFNKMIGIPTLRVGMKITQGSDEDCKGDNMDEVLAHIQLLYSNLEFPVEAEAQVEKEVIRYNRKLKKDCLHSEVGHSSQVEDKDSTKEVCIS